MASEVIKLNLIPTGTMPVFHASQFDTGRLITCELYRGEDAYSVPEGYTVELHCRKVDNNIVTMASTLINDNVVTFTSTEQLTACNGNNLCEVAILDDGYRIGTLNFIMEVEIDPLKGGINSTSEIHNLETQVEEITTDIIGENYYDKSEVDDLLSAKADSDSVYTIGEVNTLLSGKANAANVYTKSQTDILLNAKADVSDLPDMTDYYTKTATDALLDDKASNTYVDSALALKANVADVYTKAETDAKIEEAIEEILPVDNAGPSAIASFTTGLALPLVNCTVGITATGGNGTPDNPIPINGYTEANITRCGVNLWDEEWEVGSINPTTGSTFNDPDRIRSKNYSPIKGGIEIYTIDPTNNWNIRLFYYDENKNYISPSGWLGNQTSTTPEGAFYFKFIMGTQYGRTYNHDISVLYPSTNRTYHPYTGNTYTIAFGQTVYGGVLDVTRGKLKPCIEYPSYNGETLSSRWLSSEATYIEGTTPPIGSQVVSLDDYGSDIDLTPEFISAVVGTNNVYSDTNGDTTVKFKDTIQNYIDKKVST